MNTTPDPNTDPATANMDDRNLAMLSHLSGMIFSIVVPLIVWLVYKDRNDKQYLVSEAKVALNFQVTVLIGYVICWVLSFILIGFALLWLLWLANLVLCIIAAMKVSKTGTYRYPYSLQLVN